MDRCIHQIIQDMLHLCNRAPTTAAQFNRILGMKYPQIRKWLRVCDEMELIEPVNSDGTPALKGVPFYKMVGKELKGGEMVYLEGNRTNYTYRITPPGKKIMASLDFIDSELERVVFPILEAKANAEAQLPHRAVSPGKKRGRPKVH